MASTHFWIRHESRATERRAPVVPADILRLLDVRASRVTVEDSPQRIVPTEDYHSGRSDEDRRGPAAGSSAPDDVVVVGIKELPDEPRELRHTYVYFAHAFKGQSDATENARCGFEAGWRTPLRHRVPLSTTRARRVVAFGYWAGYVGAALGVLQLAGRLGHR